MEESKQKLSQPFVPIPISFLKQVIANENIPISHRVLALILWKMFDTRKRERDKLTISYIAKVLNTDDRRNIQRTVEFICKMYPFYIEDNGQGKTNKILLRTCVTDDTSVPASQTTQVPASQATQVPASQTTQVPASQATHNIEYRIEDSIEYVDTTGDEWC